MQKKGLLGVDSKFNVLNLYMPGPDGLASLEINIPISRIV